jgi:hypothetical protein
MLTTILNHMLSHIRKLPSWTPILNNNTDRIATHLVGIRVEILRNIIRRAANFILKLPQFLMIRDKELDSVYQTSRFFSAERHSKRSALEPKKEISSVSDCNQKLHFELIVNGNTIMDEGTFQCNYSKGSTNKMVR